MKKGWKNLWLGMGKWVKLGKAIFQKRYKIFFPGYKIFSSIFFSLSLSLLILLCSVPMFFRERWTFLREFFFDLEWSSWLSSLLIHWIKVFNSTYTVTISSSHICKFMNSITVSLFSLSFLSSYNIIFR